MKSTTPECVFAQTTFQFDGHLADYLIAHTRELVLVRFQTRFGTGSHQVCHYRDGEILAERSYASASGILGYYLGLWRIWFGELRRFSREHSAVLAIFTHPLLAFGCSRLRNVRTVFWQWDYFPDGVLVSRLFNAVARHYAHRVDRYCPLTSAIAAAMGCPETHPLPLGMTVPDAVGGTDSRRLLMVGQLRPGQGVEAAITFIATHEAYSLVLLGRAVAGYGDELRRLIAERGVGDRVEFPDRLIPESELRQIAAGCLASMALYDPERGNLTHYADPGKVKSSIEMGLPVVMTRVSGIVPWIERFRAGEVIDSLDELPAAIERIRANPADYVAGCRAFAEHFEAERLYAEAFSSRGE